MLYKFVVWSNKEEENAFLIMENRFARFFIIFMLVFIESGKFSNVNALSTPQFPADFIPYPLKEAKQWSRAIGLSWDETETLINYRKKYNDGATPNEKTDVLVSDGQSDSIN